MKLGKRAFRALKQCYCLPLNVADKSLFKIRSETLEELVDKGLLKQVTQWEITASGIDAVNEIDEQLESLREDTQEGG